MENNEKKSAVEFILNIGVGKDENGKTVYVKDFISMAENQQANKMFEMQIKDAFEMGQINVYENHDIDSDDYYQLNFTEKNGK